MADPLDMQGGYQRHRPTSQVGQETEYAGGHREEVSKAVEGVAIGFGLAVSLGTTSKQCKLGGASKFIGIALSQKTRTGGTADQYESNHIAAILRVGYIDVMVTNPVVALETPVRFLAADGTFGAAAGATAVTITGATYETDADAGGIARVRLT